MNAEKVRELFNYDPETGELTWKSHISSHVAGSSVGTRSTRGYIMVRFEGEYLLAHRLAFAWMTGRWPYPQIDHVNMVLWDNRWCNLREATASENAANRKVAATNVLGLKGVIKRKGEQFRHAPYEAYIRKNGKRSYLGRFKTAEEAAEAYTRAANLEHGKFARS